MDRSLIQIAQRPSGVERRERASKQLAERDWLRAGLLGHPIERRARVAEVSERKEHVLAVYLALAIDQLHRVPLRSSAAVVLNEGVIAGGHGGAWNTHFAGRVRRSRPSGG